MSAPEQRKAACSPQEQRQQPSHPDISSATEITHLYLTFDTPLPTAHTAASRNETQSSPPPPPDLTPFTNPIHWPRHRKNVMVALSCLATFLTAYTAGSYAPTMHVIAAALDAPYSGVVAGISTFCLGFALAPMVLAPLSEINGRYPVFVVSGILFVASQAVCGAVRSLAPMLVARFLTGVGGSVFSTMVGGVIADMWDADGRNTPMALFSGSVLVGTGAGPLVGALFASESVARADGWRWIFWHQVIAAGVLMIALVVLFHESRGSVLLSRRARALNKWYEALEAEGLFGVWVEEGSLGVPPASQLQEQSSTDLESVVGSERNRPTPGSRVDNGSDEKRKASSRRSSLVSSTTLQRIRWKVKADEERSSIGKMISISVSRPFHLLFTEPVVFFFSLWVSFAWAVLYLTFGCVPLVYTTVYGWSIQASGRIFIAMIVGSIVATAAGIAQERVLRHPSWAAEPEAIDPSSSSAAARWPWPVLRRRLPTNVPESRLYFTCVSATMLPIGLFVFGLSARPDLHWFGPAIAIAFATIGIFVVYLAAFNYLADVYHAYASSALAAQSFCRNLLGGVFPLVTRPLFENLGPAHAGVLLGCIATALTFVPWVLVFYGERIRARSQFAVALDKT